MIPTFLGSTILVFIILQMAPGGPIEQIMLQMQMGGAMGAEGGGGAASSTTSQGMSLPPEAMKELKRFYGFDKPIYQRYLIWLGVWPREIKHRDFTIPSNNNSYEKRVGKKDGKVWKVDVVVAGNNKLEVKEKTSKKNQHGMQKLMR